VKLNGLILLLVIGASGCASQNVTIRSWPPETPAADNAANTAKAQELIAVSTVAATSETRGEAADAARSPKAGGADVVPLVTPADAPSMDTYDPWARLNRFTYRFNARFDEAVFLPVANGYRRLPSPLRSGVHNFFGNLSEIDSVINYTLQGRLGRGVRSLGRFVINSTIGIGGLFDVATKLHLANSPTGFGTTLAKWGMHPGPYLVIPFFGPSTLREGIGLATDYGTSYAINVVDLYRGDKSWGLGVLNAVDQRANTNFRYYATGSPFEYSTIRFLYVRKLLLEDAGLHRKKAPTKPNPDAPAGQ
jgi:phospholipid-binding lipoprotein MlaA